MKGTAQVAFFLASAYRLLLIGMQGKVPLGLVVRSAAFTIPAVLVFLLLGHRLAARGSAGLFKRVVFVMLCMMGLTVLVRALFATVAGQ